MIKVVTNKLGSDDWVSVVGPADQILFEGHVITASDLVSILNTVTYGSNIEADLVEVTDEQLEAGEF